MPKLAIIHTTPSTVEPLRALALEIIPECSLVNFVDDSILPQLAETNGDLSRVQDRIVQYARFAEAVGAEIVLQACSSVGEAVPAAQAAVNIPIVRIDEAMAERAVAEGTRIGVVATLATTLEPTTRLVAAKAAAAGKTADIQSLLVAGAYDCLIAGDQAGHDHRIADALHAIVKTSDCIILAQASMARVLPRLSATQQQKCLTSPRLGMERVKQVLEQQTAR